MQVRADERFRDFRTAPNALDEMYAPIQKIDVLASLILESNRDIEKRPFSQFSTLQVETIGYMIEDALEDIKFLVHLAIEQSCQKALRTQ